MSRNTPVGPTHPVEDLIEPYHEKGRQNALSMDRREWFARRVFGRCCVYISVACDRGNAVYVEWGRVFSRDFCMLFTRIWFPVATTTSQHMLFQTFRLYSVKLDGAPHQWHTGVRKMNSCRPPAVMSCWKLSSAQLSAAVGEEFLLVELKRVNYCNTKRHGF